MFELGTLQCKPQLSKSIAMVPSARKPTFLIVVYYKAANLKEELNPCKEEKMLIAHKNLLDGHKIKAHMVN